MPHRDALSTPLINTPLRSVRDALLCLIVALYTSIASVAAASVEATSLQKVGEARLKVLLWSIYDTRLYTRSGEYSEGERPLRLEVQYLIDINAAELAERTLDEWTSMGRNHPQQESWADSLADLWPDIQANDVISLELGENEVARFLHNGDLLGNIDDPEFGQSFVDIWLSPDTTRPKLRSGLLGREN